MMRCRVEVSAGIVRVAVGVVASPGCLCRGVEDIRGTAFPETPEARTRSGRAGGGRARVL